MVWVFVLDRKGRNRFSFRCRSRILRDLAQKDRQISLGLQLSIVDMRSGKGLTSSSPIFQVTTKTLMAVRSTNVPGETMGGDGGGSVRARSRHGALRVPSTGEWDVKRAPSRDRTLASCVVGETSRSVEGGAGAGLSRKNEGGSGIFRTSILYVSQQPFCIKFEFTRRPASSTQCRLDAVALFSLLFSLVPETSRINNPLAVARRLVLRPPIRIFQVKRDGSSSLLSRNSQYRMQRSKAVKG